jgi:hypothetical protein
MRPELIEIAEIEQYLLGKASGEQAAAIKTRMLLSNSFYEKVESQKLVYRFIKLFSRRRQRKVLESIYANLSREPLFSETVKTIFR